MLSVGRPIRKNESVFRLGRNSWRIHRARHAALIVDCAAFYRAIHQSISKAQHSVFVLGWEIDSRTRLLRGDEERNTLVPSVAAELLAWKALQNRDLRIYLLRWDATVVFANEREVATELSWTTQTPENVHVCMDNTVPFGGGHHQKIILVDDEVAFTGGMDIARQRWDEREHRIDEPERNDANGPYGPYHDAHCVMDGDITKAFSELVRWRWKRAAGYSAVSTRTLTSGLSGLTSTWPDSLTPHLTNIRCAVARTFPKTADTEAVEEIRKMYLDLIREAGSFIYIENQFLTCDEIARALNQRLKQVPALRALLVSSYDPQGFFEREGMWAGRMEFKAILEAGLPPDRIKMTYPVTLAEDGTRHYKRIHSKILVIDDRYLVVASSNLSRRSLHLDTECDAVFEAETPEHSQTILRLRDDLIAEHTGKSIESVHAAIEHNDALNRLLEKSAGPGQYFLQEIDDQKFIRPPAKLVALRLIDPEKPLIAVEKPPPNPQRFTLAGAAVTLLFFVGVGILISSGEFTPEKVKSFLEQSRTSALALPTVCLLYIVGSFVLFPVTLLSLITAAVFGPIRGPIYGLVGAMLSTAIMFWVGHLAGLKGLRRLIGDRIRRIDARFKRSGVAGVVVVRILPIAPFGVVNLAAGISSVRFTDFMLGSLFGFLPGFLAKGIVGDSLVQAFIQPSQSNFIYLILGILFWVGLIAGTHFLAKRWQTKHADTEL